jgi:hypothetical protein
MRLRARDADRLQSVVFVERFAEASRANTSKKPRRAWLQQLTSTTRGGPCSSAPFAVCAPAIP